MAISIHAPARGATSVPGDYPRQTAHFNPRSRTGSDCAQSRYMTGCQEFQSTLPHGERLHSAFCLHFPYLISIHAPARGATEAPAMDSPSTRNFNPRSRTGSDHAAGTERSSVLISIHAPARGATADEQAATDAGYISIHAPARGATPQNHKQHSR